MNPLIAAILGFVEGVTEYLPVSSTGHLILVGHLLGLEGEGADAFDIVIQLGAILAVVVQYRRLLWRRATGLVRREPESISLLTALVLGFVPTAVTGLLLRKKIKALLFGPRPVAIALVVGGIVMIFVELVRKQRRITGEAGLEKVTPKRAFLIGLGQCLSMWPGTSRSLVTIISGQLVGLSTATAAEFSFLLGLPTLGAATLYEAYKSRAALATLGVTNVAIGLVVSFFVAWAVIALFIGYLKTRTLVPFGIYRIALGTFVFFRLSQSELERKEPVSAVVHEGHEHPRLDSGGVRLCRARLRPSHDAEGKEDERGAVPGSIGDRPARARRSGRQGSRIDGRSRR